MAKSQDKLEYINMYIERLNERLRNRSFKIVFENKGANNYCLKINDEYFSFNTYDDVTNCLLFIDFMFEETKKELGGKKRDKSISTSRKSK